MRTRLGALARAISALACALIACSTEERSHVFAGRLWEADRACLESVTSIDVVDGPLPAAPCDPACIVPALPADGGARALYVSTMCAPFPPASDTSGTDPRCAVALAAYSLNTTCLADGGIANAPRDASAD